MKIKIQGHLTMLYMVLFQTSFVILSSTHGSCLLDLVVIGPQWVKKQTPV